jgi:hypothetical protein
LHYHPADRFEDIINGIQLFDAKPPTHGIDKTKVETMINKLPKKSLLFMSIVFVVITLACESSLARPISSAPAEDITFTYQGKGTTNWRYNVNILPDGEKVITCPVEAEMTLTINSGKVTLKSLQKKSGFTDNQDYVCHDVNQGEIMGVYLYGRYDMSTDQITFTNCLTTTGDPATGTAKMVNGRMTGEGTCPWGDSFNFALDEVK